MKEEKNWNSKVIIFPDIHGRKFWKPVYERYKDDTQVRNIVFLGDYLDAYDFENISDEEAIDNFKDILESTKDNSKVELLLGNHDIHYLPPLDENWGCRRYDSHLPEIQKLFLDNYNRFKISYIIKNEEGKDWVFSHAGFTNGWIKTVLRLYNEEITPYNANTLLEDENGLYMLAIVGPERGGYYRNYGSCLWADVHEHLDRLPFEDYYKNIYQIFGHTLNFPNYENFDEYEINEWFAMLDSRRAFELDLNNGEIKEVKL